jgi:hypothetical protein
MNEVTYWIVFHDADTTETGMTMNRTYVRAEWAGHAAQRHDRLLLEAWCAERFGSKVAYVQGVAACENWIVRESNEADWRAAQPTMWGGMPTKTTRLSLKLGVRSGLDKAPIKVIWEQDAKATPISSDAVFCPHCGKQVTG